VSPGGLQQSSRGSFISAASDLPPFSQLQLLHDYCGSAEQFINLSSSAASVAKQSGIAPVTIVAAIIVLWIISLASLAVTLPPDFWARRTDDAK
jgi:hypothetical protein